MADAVPDEDRRDASGEDRGWLEAAALGEAVKIVRSLVGRPVATLRRIAARTSVQHAAELAETLIRANPQGCDSDWLRCLLTEFYFMMRRTEDCRALARTLTAPRAPSSRSLPAVPDSVAASAAVAEALADALIDAPAAARRARDRLERAEDGAQEGPESVAAAAILAEACWRAGELEEGLTWVRFVAAGAARIPSPYWRMHLLAEAASKFADAGAPAEAEAAAEAVRRDAQRHASCGIEAALGVVAAKGALRAGRWHRLADEVRAEPAGTLDSSQERRHGPRLLLMQSLAALYAGEGATAQFCFHRAHKLLGHDEEVDSGALSLWTGLLLDEAEHGPHAAIAALDGIVGEVGPGRGFAAGPGAFGGSSGSGGFGGSPLIGLFAVVPGSAAWVARTAARTDRPDWIRTALDLSSTLRRRNPGLPALAVAADHVRGIATHDDSLLINVAIRACNAWVRSTVAGDLVACLAARPGWSAGPDVRPNAAGPLPSASAGGRADTPAAQVGQAAQASQTGAGPADSAESDGPAGSRWNHLSPSEQTVACLATAGHTNRQIASRIPCSPHTVNFHMRNIFQKLMIRSRVEIAGHLPYAMRPAPAEYESSPRIA